jgi:hypothetical protein
MFSIQTNFDGVDYLDCGEFSLSGDKAAKLWLILTETENRDRFINLCEILAVRITSPASQPVKPVLTVKPASQPAWGEFVGNQNDYHPLTKKSIRYNPESLAIRGFSADKKTLYGVYSGVIYQWTPKTTTESFWQKVNQNTRTVNIPDNVLKAASCLQASQPVLTVKPASQPASQPVLTVKPAIQAQQNVKRIHAQFSMGECEYTLFDDGTYTRNELTDAELGIDI